MEPEFPKATRSSVSRVMSKINLKLVAVLGVNFILHMLAIRLPNSKVFDENFYIPAAHDILKGVASNPEHPFLGKAWIALGIFLFGDGWLGWRIPVVIFSTLSLITFYYLSKRFLSNNLAVYSTALLGFEVMFFVHGSLALLEIPSIFFALLSFVLYFKRRFWLSAGSMGLSLLSKETALFFILILLFYHVSRVHYRSYRELIPKFYRGVIFLVIIGAVFLVPITLYDQVYKPSSSTQVLVSYTVVELKDERGVVTATTTITNTTTRQVIIGHGLQHFLFIVSYASSLPITNQSDVNPGNYAWNWILPIPNLVPPAPYYVESVNVAKTIKEGDVVKNVIVETTHPVAWYGIGSMPVWWSIWLLIPFLLYNIVKRRTTRLDTFLLIWIGATYLSMLYISGANVRIVYPFYFIQTIPALTLGLPYFLDHFFKQKILRIIIFTAFIAVHLYIFAFYFPIRDISKLLPL